MDCVSNSGRPSFCAGLPSGGGSHSMVETLQANLKQRDGENHQLQWELSRLQTDRNALMAEVSDLTMRLDNVSVTNVVFFFATFFLITFSAQIKEKLEQCENIEEQFADLQQKYDALLQMYGEKVEEIQEVNLDLEEVKEMYRGQIDELLRQQKMYLQNAAKQ